MTDRVDRSDMPDSSFFLRQSCPERGLRDPAVASDLVYVLVALCGALPL